MKPYIGCAYNLFLPSRFLSHSDQIIFELLEKRAPKQGEQQKFFHGAERWGGECRPSSKLNNQSSRQVATH